MRTDDLARKALEQTESVSSVRERWGSRVVGQDGSLDRKRIAEIVFSDGEELAWLEELLHPVVRSMWMAALEEDRRSDVVVEIPLLFEKNLAFHFDFVVSVDCPESQQRQRLCAKGLSEEEIEARKSRQFPAAKKNAEADFVLTNCGTLPLLEKQVFRLSRRLRGLR